MLSPECGSACAGEAMIRDSSVRSTFASLWFRLISLGIVGLAFAQAVFLAKSRIQGWTFYLTNLKSVIEGGADLRETQTDLAGLVNF